MEQDKNRQEQDLSNQIGESEADERRKPPYSYPAWLSEEDQANWFEECPPGLNGLSSQDFLIRNMAMIEYQFNHPGQQGYAFSVAQYYYSNGLTDLKANDYQTALFWFERTIAFLTPDQIDLRACVHLYAGKALSNWQRYPEALLALDEALRLAPSLNQPNLMTDMYYTKGGMLFSIGRREEALASFDQALAIAIPLNLPHGGILLGKGNTLDMLERREEALEAYAAALKRNPDWDLVYYNRALVFFNLQRYTEALADFDRALELGLNHTEIFPRKARTLKLLGRSEEAIQVLKQGIEQYPQSSLLYLAKAEILEQLQRFREALEAVEEADRLEPENPTILSVKASIMKHL